MLLHTRIYSAFLDVLSVTDHVALLLFQAEIRTGLVLEATLNRERHRVTVFSAYIRAQVSVATSEAQNSRYNYGKALVTSTISLSLLDARK